MTTVVGVSFLRAGRVYWFDPNGVEVKDGMPVIVETARGNDYGSISGGVMQVEDEQVVQPLRRVLREATPEDMASYDNNRDKEKNAFGIAQDKIARHKLEMKLVDVEYSFDGAHIVFYFTANGRVDFRELVRDLASVFRARIELRQIGVRDEAKMIGGLGPCGRPICCRQFLPDFQPVSIKMAKEQGLSLNPTKISGQCGRLMCCLKYEQDAYEAARKRMPKVGREVDTPDGPGTVIDVNVLKERLGVKVQLKDGSWDIRHYMFDTEAEVERGARHMLLPDQPKKDAEEDFFAHGFMPEAPPPPVEPAPAAAAVPPRRRPQQAGRTGAPPAPQRDAQTPQPQGEAERPRRPRRRGGRRGGGGPKPEATGQ